MAFEESVLLIGRLLFGGYFVYNGLNHLRNLKMMAGYTASKGVPSPALLVVLSGLLILLGGLSVILGLYPTWGLAAIAIFLVVVTPVMHRYWELTEPMQRVGEFVNFTKNLALLGAALALMAVSQPWPWALSR